MAKRQTKAKELLGDKLRATNAERVADILSKPLPADPFQSYCYALLEYQAGRRTKESLDALCAEICGRG